LWVSAPQIGSSELFAWGWLWSKILLISASWVARITGMRHQLPALFLPFHLSLVIPSVSLCLKKIIQLSCFSFLFWQLKMEKLKLRLMRAAHFFFFSQKT
jgi:hypothetical protein